MPQESKQRLDQWLIALQKTFSRVTDATKQNAQQDKITAMMVDEVKFEIRVQVDLEDDKILVDKNSKYDIILQGTIDLDSLEIHTKT